MGGWAGGRMGEKKTKLMLYSTQLKLKLKLELSLAKALIRVVAVAVTPDGRTALHSL